MDEGMAFFNILDGGCCCWSVTTLKLKAQFRTQVIGGGECETWQSFQICHCSLSLAATVRIDLASQAKQKLAQSGAI